jgi:hypothetical protein
MRRTVVALFFALSFGSVAQAAEFIVVGSTDPNLKTGQSLDGGEHLPLYAGRTLTLMRPSGEVLTIRGAPSGIVLPGASAGQGGGSKFDAVQALFARPPSGHTYGARRGFCPGPEILDNIDAIVRANQAGCHADARAAFIEYLKVQGVSAQDADALYARTIVTDPADAATQ